MTVADIDPSNVGHHSIPFLPRFYEPVRLGQKTMTCRTKQFGSPGDRLDAIFRNPGRPWDRLRIRLTDVREERLGDIADRHFLDEGCASRDEFVEVWESIHRRRGFDPDQIVWLHVFRCLDSNTPEDFKLMAAEPGGVKQNMADAQPKRLSLEELRSITAKAVKDATTFEKTPTFVMNLGTEIVFRVKKIISGKFKNDDGKPANLVISDDLRVFDATTGKFASQKLSAYTQDGKDGPKTLVEVAPGAEVRIPNFVVRRFQENGIELVPKYMYWARYIEDKKVAAGTFKVAAVSALGTNFPE